MAMGMAMARARMAMAHCCNGIRQVSVRRFKVGAGNNSNNRSYSSVGPGGFEPSSSFPTFLVAATLGYFCLNICDNLRENRELETLRKKGNERRRKMLEENGINRESCEAEIARIKQEIESGSDSHVNRDLLKTNEEWLEELFTKGE